MCSVDATENLATYLIWEVSMTTLFICLDLCTNSLLMLSEQGHQVINSPILSIVITFYTNWFDIGSAAIPIFFFKFLKEHNSGLAVAPGYLEIHAL